MATELAKLVLKVKPITSFCFRPNPNIGKYMVRFKAGKIDGELARKMSLIKNGELKDPYAGSNMPPIITISEIKYCSFVRNAERLASLSKAIDMATNLNVDPDYIIQEMSDVTIFGSLVEFEYRDNDKKGFSLSLDRVEIDENEFTNILYRKVGIL